MTSRPSARPGSAASRSETEHDAAQADYRRALDERLTAVHQTAAADGCVSWDAMLAATDGADPRIVAQRARALDITPTDMAVEEPHGIDDPWTPELHALDFEWYFDPVCADMLAARVAGPGRDVLCLGTPTVAAALLPRDDLRRVTLVDRNPLAHERCATTSALSRGQRRARIDTLIDDLASVRLDQGRYDVAVADAPWYPAALAHWLSVAAHAVRPGGQILFALMAPLHRPTARDDRAEILGRARELGPVSVETAALRYRSPRFEREALATAGLRTPERWRSADLVTVQRRQLPVRITPRPSPVCSAEHRWTRFVLGSQVVQLDLGRGDSADDGPLLRPVSPTAADYRYGSISTRDPLRSAIGLWTSRSRVAQVRRPAIVGALLEHLATSGDRAALTSAPALRGLDEPTRRQAVAALQAILY